LLEHLIERELGQVREEEKDAAEMCANPPRFETEKSKVGALSRRGLKPLDPLIIFPARQSGKAFLLENDVDGGDAQAPALLSEEAGDIVNGEVLFAHGDDLLTKRVLLGRLLRPFLWGKKEGAVEVLAKFGADDAKTAWCVAEAFGRLLGREPLNEVGSESLILAVSGVLGEEESPLFSC
jgi:hypothetical protein